MRIGIVADNLDDQVAGGLRTYVLGLVNNLLRLDEENEYFLVRSRPGSESTRLGAHEVVLGREGLCRSKEIRKGLAMPLALRRFELDIVHETYHFGPFLLPARYRKVLVVHDIIPFLLDGMHKSSSVWRHRLFMQAVLSATDRVITVSQRTKRDLMERLACPEEKIRVIYEAAGEGFAAAPDREAFREVAARYGLEGPFILFVGQLEPRKNVEALIAAFARIAGSIPHNLVVVGGKGWGYEGIFEAVAREGVGGRVLFTGFVPDEDLPSLYHAADFFVYPSLYEGFGLPVLEAMTCGCPVMTSNLSSLPEIAGDAALCVDPRDGKAMEGAIRKLALNASLREDLARKGLERAKHFSWERCARETLDIYRELAS